MDKDLKDHRIETLENQVKDLQKIKQDLQNKLLNSEKSIIEKNSQIKVMSSLMDSYSKKIKELEFELKDKDSEINNFEIKFKRSEEHFFIALVLILILFTIILGNVIVQ